MYHLLIVCQVLATGVLHKKWNATMLKLYCQCGYPIWVKARRDGADVVIVLHDGKQRPSREAALLSFCPQCQRELTPTRLHWQAIPPRYFPWD